MTESPIRHPERVSTDTRNAVYHRLHWLWPLLAHPMTRRVVRGLAWAGLVFWLLFVMLVSALRFVVLPGIGDYRHDIERLATQAVGQPVHIGRLEARWRGLSPDLVLDDVQVEDRNGGTAFSLTRIEGVLSWQSVVRFKPILSLLAFEGPVLRVKRDSNGKITVAGVDTEGESDPAFAEWVLEQKRIRIHNATIVWDDRLREAPELILEDVQFALDNHGRRHRFGLSAAPPESLAARVNVRGEIKGDLGDALEHLAGRVYVELDYADLAGWRAWVDYPVHLPQGRGALRVWGDLDDGMGKLTADVALDDVRIRLGKKLPELDLASMRGRLEASYKTNQWMLAGHKVELTTREGARVPPTDFRVEWQLDPRTDTVDGKASASLLDLSVLSGLAAYMPLDAQSRQLLQAHRPRGQIGELRAGWSLSDDTLKRYSLKAAFTKLGVDAEHYFPGFEGVSGKVDLTEKGGDVTVDAGASRLSLPAVFPEPDIALDLLKLKASWRNTSEATDVRLDRLEFAGADAAGSARGSYRYTGNGPGEIDLAANVDRADGRAVWRYMPSVVNAEARAWLKQALLAGKASEGRLVLKGNLDDFPFRDPKTGKFSVTAKATGVRLHYADGWPAIDGIEGDMSFGIGMKIAARKGAVTGTTLSGITADIPDFGANDTLLQVRGLAQGATSSFLHFISQSPIADNIEHFTDGMKAAGNGSLNLELDVPLSHATDTRMRGDYRFLNNELQPLAGLPPLTQVNGRLQLTESTAQASDITGRVFGGPLKVQVHSVGDKISVLANGTANIVEVSRHFGWPLMNHLTGSSTWRADIGIRRKSADLLIESDLLGISSPLPEPLNKVATAALPLRIERNALDAQREQYKITLGKVGQGLMIRRQENWERGVFAVGDAEARLPDKGLAIRVASPRIDADAWKLFLPENGTGSGDSGGLPLSVVALKTAQLHLFERDFSQVDIALRPRDGGWQIGLNTREALGDIYWRTAGEGWVEGNFKRLYLRGGTDSGTVGERNTALVNSLPGMNLMVDDLHLGDIALGRLELKARNDKGAWHLDTLNLQNPDAALKGKGVWVNGSRHQTRLDFELAVKDIGKLLERLGYGDIVRRGTARLTGDMQWQGPLTTIHYPSLTGQMNVEAEKGQFNKLEPGVGKLLGLLSLQSLPRRLTLDFRDIFSDGLAFDSIEGKVAVRKGVMRTTEPLRIGGPAVQVEMQGETDLKAETQDLDVLVRPEIGSLAAVGAAALVNPVAGAAALVANTVLKKPLNRLFSYRYHVTGSWADPKVDKAGETTQSHPNEPEEKQP